MPLEIQTIMKKTRPSAALVAAIMLLLCGIICLIPSCKKEKAPQVLSEPTSFDVPELVHVYGGYPFTLPIVTEPEVSDISALEFNHPDKENFKLKIVDNQAVLTYIPLEEEGETEVSKVRSETLRVGSEKLGYKDVVVHVASTPLFAAFLSPIGVADISDGAYLRIEGQPSEDNYGFLIAAGVPFQDIEGNVPSFTEEDLSLHITAPSGKIISQEIVNSSTGNLLGLVYTKEVEGEMEITYTFTDKYSVAGKNFDKEYSLSFTIASWYFKAEGAHKALHDDGYLLESMPYYGAKLSYDNRNRIVGFNSGIVGPVTINPDTGICSTESLKGTVRYTSEGLLEQLVLKDANNVDSLYCEYDVSGHLSRYDHQFIVIKEEIVPWREEAVYIWKDGLISKVEGKSWSGPAFFKEYVAEYSYDGVENKYGLFTASTHTLRGNRDFMWPILLSGLMGPAGNQLPSSYTCVITTVKDGEDKGSVHNNYVSEYLFYPDGRIQKETIKCNDEIELNAFPYTYTSIE